MKEALDYFEGDELRARIFLEKYALKDENGNILEKTPPEMWKRIVKSLELTPADDYLWLLDNFRFVPGGRILYGVGNDLRRNTPFNCYVIPIKDDSLSGIYECAKEMAITYSLGGGCGIDISILRPADSPVNNTAIKSTGAVSFMELFSLTTGLIGQGFRRGALMITIEDWHPDVLAFIHIKQNLQSVRYANISVKVSDEFMEAVRRDRYWYLRYQGPYFCVEKKVKARELFDAIVKAAHGWAEPGLLFFTTAKRMSNSEYYAPVLTTNPCSEQFLPPYGACNLGSLNLFKFVVDPFTDHAQIDYVALEKATRLAVRFLDAVITYAEKKHKYPLVEQEERQRLDRRIGLGVMGLADLFFALGIRYDSDRALELADELFAKIRDWAYDESINLAAELGPFPAFNWEGYSQSEFVKSLPSSLKRRLKEKGIRNVTILSVAPTGSIGTMAGVSTGIEPIFAVKFFRRSESLSKGEYEVFHPTVQMYMKVNKTQQLPPYLVTAHEIDPYYRVELQSVIQRYVDTGISSTVNLPASTSVETVRDIYMEAWKRGCKGITVYREGSREDVLYKEKAPKRVRFSRPDMLSAVVTKLKTEAGNIYVTVSKDDEGNAREVFIHIGKSGTTVNSLTEALGRLISISLQYDVPVDDIVKQLHLIRSGYAIKQRDGKVTFSIPDAIAYAIKKALSLENGNDMSSLIEEMAMEKEVKVGEGNICPQCGSVLYKLGNCDACLICGFSLCT